MPLDPSISLHAQLPQVQIPDLTRTLLAGAQLREANQQAALRGLQAQQIALEMQEQQGLMGPGGPMQRLQALRGQGLAGVAPGAGGMGLPPQVAPQVAPAPQAFPLDPGGLSPELPPGALLPGSAQPRSTVPLPGMLSGIQGTSAQEAAAPGTPEAAGGAAPGQPSREEQRRAILEEMVLKYPRRGPAMAKTLLDMDAMLQDSQKSELLNQKTKLEMQLKGSETLFNLASGVENAEDYQEFRGIAQRMGIPGAEALPPQYDPRVIQYYTTVSRTAKERIDQQLMGIHRQIEARNVGIRGSELGLKEREAARQDVELGLKQRESARQEAELGLKEQEIGVQRAQRATTNEMAAQKEFNDQTKNYRILSEGYSRVVSAAEDPSQAGDIALVYGYMKMLDPGSTVMVGEQATATNAGNISERIRGLYNRLISDDQGRMDESVRQDFLNRAGRLHAQATQDYTKYESTYKDVVKRQGLNPANVVLPYQSTATPTPVVTSKLLQEMVIADQQRASAEGRPPRDLATIKRDLAAAGYRVSDAEK